MPRKGAIGPGRVALVISDRPGVRALEKAGKAGIKTEVVGGKARLTREERDGLIEKIIIREKIGLIVLAGFMKVLGPGFVKKFYGKIINIHPALLPSFKGVSGIADAFRYGVKVTGVTVHFVDEGVDSGPIIAQKEVNVEEKDTLATLEKKIHEQEYKLYPEAIRLFAENKLKISGRKVKITQKGAKNLRG